jgi:hypothetical protein
VKEQNVNDNRSEEGQREWNIPVGQEQGSADELKEKYHDQIVRDEERPHKLTGRSGRKRRGEEVEETVQSEDEKDKAKQNTSDDSSDFHVSFDCLIHIILTSI